MAAKFYNSTAAGAGTGADWTNAYTSITAAMAGISAGDTLWIGDNSAESVAGALTITSPGTTGTPCFLYCVDHTVASPGTGDLKTTATISTTLANALTINGSFYCYGVIFTAGSGANSPSLTVNGAVTAFQNYQSCSLRGGGTSGSSIVFGATNRNSTELYNTTVSFANAGAGISIGGRMTWKNTSSALLGTVPTSLFLSTNNAGQIVCEGIDFSAMGAGSTIVAAIAGSEDFFLKDCKFGASVTVAAAQAGPGAGRVFVIRSDSAGTNYRHEKYVYTGTQVVETTIVRTGGASDGTTPLSWKITTTANSKWVLPYEALPIAIWNPTITGNVTVTVQGTWNQAAVPNNNDIWLVAEYLGSSSSPLGSFATNTIANNLATGTALPASASAWGGGGSGAGWSPFTLTKTFTAPAQAGTMYIYVYAANASKTFYVDPLVVLS